MGEVDPVKLSTINQLAMDVLRRLADTERVQPTPDNNLPGKWPAVRAETWRERFYEVAPRDKAGHETESLHARGARPERRSFY